MQFDSQRLSSNILGALVRFVIGWHPVLGAFHTLVDVVANQIVGFLRRSPLDENGRVGFPGSNHLTRSRRYTWEQEFQSNSKGNTCTRLGHHNDLWAPESRRVQLALKAHCFHRCWQTELWTDTVCPLPGQRLHSEGTEWGPECSRAARRRHQADTEGERQTET